jgi:hypothetical protein
LCRCLVQRRCQQCVVNELYPSRELTLPSGHDHVEVVVCAEGGLADGAAFWRMRVHVVEVGNPAGYLRSPKSDSPCRQLCVRPPADRLACASKPVILGARSAPPAIGKKRRRVMSTLSSGKSRDRADETWLQRESTSRRSVTAISGCEC